MTFMEEAMAAETRGPAWHHEMRTVLPPQARGFYSTSAAQTASQLEKAEHPPWGSWDLCPPKWHKEGENLLPFQATQVQSLEIRGCHFDSAQVTALLHQEWLNSAKKVRTMRLLARSPLSYSPKVTSHYAPVWTLLNVVGCILRPLLQLHSGCPQTHSHLSSLRQTQRWKHCLKSSPLHKHFPGLQILIIFPSPSTSWTFTYVNFTTPCILKYRHWF